MDKNTQFYLFSLLSALLLSYERTLWNETIALLASLRCKCTQNGHQINISVYSTLN